MCKSNGLSTSGVKSDLVDKLFAHFNGKEDEDEEDSEEEAEIAKDKSEDEEEELEEQEESEESEEEKPAKSKLSGRKRKQSDTKDEVPEYEDSKKTKKLIENKALTVNLPHPVQNNFELPEVPEYVSCFPLDKKKFIEFSIQGPSEDHFLECCRIQRCFEERI